MFGTFGCRDDFRECHNREREEVREQRPAVCNVLRNISVGTEISFLKIRGNGTFHNVVFEGFANGVALAMQQGQGQGQGQGGKDNQGNRDTFTGILRVCPTDVIAIAI
ncbi:DUF3915 family protein [Bacillus cereus group sp. BfR-BA-01316]|uniref:DUF3915 family protein n=1 Tax=Bacillus cereus group sp. BfR-BA-01316 TaxID=2920293 RepID=UPI001F56EA3C|nr:DUF3915 family protein [Bacillus cereus group sp. BfR-BA-01316]